MATYIFECIGKKKILALGHSEKCGKVDITSGCISHTYFHFGKKKPVTEQNPKYFKCIIL